MRVWDNWLHRFILLLVYANMFVTIQRGLTLLFLKGKLGHEEIKGLSSVLQSSASHRCLESPDWYLFPSLQQGWMISRRFYDSSGFYRFVCSMSLAFEILLHSYFQEMMRSKIHWSTSRLRLKNVRPRKHYLFDTLTFFLLPFQSQPVWLREITL